MLVGLVIVKKPEEAPGAGNPLKVVTALDTSNRILKEMLGQEDYAALMALNNTKLNQVVAENISLCRPKRVFFCDGSEKSQKFIEEEALRNGEEKPLGAPGHTIHFDGTEDQGRAIDDTYLLVPKGGELAGLNCMEREKGLREMRKRMDGIMEKGTGTMYIKVHTLGVGERSLLCLQITDSAYVAHSADLLYRQGYDEFRKRSEAAKFFTFVHSAGELTPEGIANPAGRMIAIDPEGKVVFSSHFQYAGNSLGMKKLALRLAIMKSAEDIAEGRMTLCEHMYIAGINGPNGRTTYAAGDFPSGCGKTSTSMLEGGTIVGDDIGIFFEKNGRLQGMNYECGMFGIIKDVNPKDDRALYYGLNGAKKAIFSNVLVYAEDPAKAQDNPRFTKCVEPQEIRDFWAGKRPKSLPPLNLQVYWLGKTANNDEKIPDKGINQEGDWWPGKEKRDLDGKIVLGRNNLPAIINPSHTNARFTMSLGHLPNVDFNLNSEEGVQIKMIVTGGKNPKAMPPVGRARDWVEGIFFTYACLESQQTSAAKRKGVSEGEMNMDPGAIKDFLPHSIGTHLGNVQAVIGSLEKKPGFYSVNYFREDEHGKFLNPDKNDKEVWIKWAELYEHSDVEAVRTPLLDIPKYMDLVKLFRDVYTRRGGERRVNPELNAETNGYYSIEEYNAQFAVRVPELLAKIDRMIGPEGRYVTEICDAPEELHATLVEIRRRLLEAQEKFGDCITPDKFETIG